MCGAGGRQPAVELVEAAAGTDGGHGTGQPPTLWRGVVDVVGDDRLDAAAGGQVGQCVVARGVQRVAVVPELDLDMAPAEHRDQPVELAACGVEPVSHQRAGDTALAATGEHQPVVAGQLAELAEISDGAGLASPQLRQADRTRQRGVAAGITRDDHQMVTVRVGDAVARPGLTDRQLGAEHGAQAQCTGGLGEAHHPVQSVVIGQGQRLQPEARCFLRQLLGVGCAVEEAEVGVAVQFPVGHRRRSAPGGGSWWLVRQARARPGRAVSAIGLRRGVARTPVTVARSDAAQPVGELPPGHRWVVPSHPREFTRTHVRCQVGRDGAT